MQEELNSWEFYLSQQNNVSVHTNWHNQHLTENLLDLGGFISSISNNLDPESLAPDERTIPLGFFQVEQPSRIRYCYIIFMFTILERRNRALIKLLTELKPEIKKDFTCYSGNFLERLKMFLKDNLAIDLSTDKKWGDIYTLQKIRDCIIHCGGCIQESRDFKFLQQLVKSDKIALNRYGYILLTDNYCKELGRSMVDFIQEGLQQLYTELEELR